MKGGKLEATYIRTNDPLPFSWFALKTSDHEKWREVQPSPTSPARYLYILPHALLHMSTHTILFDGVCNLCNGLVQFIIKRDPQGKFKFASLQSAAGQRLLRQYGLPVEHFSSIVYIRDGQCFQKSTAVLQLLRDLGGIWKSFSVLNILPRSLRDFFYSLVARSRYRLFGKRDSCMIPTPDLKARFMD